MALKTLTGYQLLLKVSDDGGATYTHYCMINSGRGIQMTNNHAETPIPDCDNPEKPHQIKRKSQSVDITASGEGLYDRGSAKFFADWANGEEPKPCKLEVGPDEGDLIYTGDMALTDFSLTSSSDQDEVTASVSLASSGGMAITVVPAA